MLSKIMTTWCGNSDVWNGKSTGKEKYTSITTSGFAEIWMFPDSVIGNKFIPILRQRLKDIYIANWREGLNACSSLSLSVQKCEIQLPVGSIHL